MVSASYAVAAILRAARKPSAGMLYALASLTWSSHALAQQAPAASADNTDQQVQEVTVTGSRIKRTTDFTTPTPTTVIDSTQMQNMGVVNVGQALSMTPANISNFTPANTGNSNFFLGAYIPDLRGLNPFFGSRTLTLIDTERAVPTDQGDSFDLNFIPQILVQRIDTVTGGASAAYGSGAIGGVINVILDNKLEGGKIDADLDQTSHSDGRDKHVSAAYGHGLFDNRVHFVVAGEFEKQDILGCQAVRTWCAQDNGLYETAASSGNAALYSYGSNLRTNEVSAAGVFMAPNPYAPYAYNPNTLQLTADGTGLNSYQGGSVDASAYSSAQAAAYATTNSSVVEGGDGRASSEYTNLTAPVSRGVLTGMLTAAVTDSINFKAGYNWGKVESIVYSGGTTNQPFVDGSFPQGLDELIGLSGQNIIGSSVVNPFGGANIPTMANAYIQQAANNGNATLLNAVNNGYDIFNKDWTQQTDPLSDQTATVRRVTAGFDGKFGESSWTWDGYGEYGLTEREQLVQNTQHAISYEMALDSVLGANGQPECRVTAAGGGLAGLAAINNPASPYYNPLAAATYGNANTMATNAILSQGCLPIDPFGTQPLSQQTLNYSFGNLDERLRYTQTVVALNSSGDIWKGFGAGAFSAAVGYEWRQEVAHNDESYCASTDTYCLDRSTDFTIQYGNPFGGVVSVNEAYLESNLPLLKDLPFAHLLEVDLAARESRYSNKELYGLNLDQDPTASTTSSHNLTTWKISSVYEPLEGIRFRGSESRDSRAPNFRELYYGQQLESISNGGFGSCSLPNSPVTAFDPCTWNLLGNTDLRPETSNTTTLGMVFTPAPVPGFQASVDWFHIKITNAIEQANVSEVEQNCAGGEAAACSQMVFDGNYYDPATGAIVAPGTAGAVTGAAAWQQGDGRVLNATTVNATSYNGAFYDVRGVDFSLSQQTILPDGSALTARILTTWTGEQVFQAYAGGPVISILGQTGAANNFLNDNNPAARWTGNMSITWSKGGFSLTPNMRFVGGGSLSYTGMTQAQNPTLYNWILEGFPDASNPAASDYQQQLYAKQYGWTAMPYNHVGSYFVFGLNGAYNFDAIPGLKGLQVFSQVDNLLNRNPPFASAPGGFNASYAGTNPIFFDTLGLRYRVGFRMSF
ncbi:MAG: TonB-dependent receptor [Steroidobacteraceae bacterium]